jgi:hypothetical protein
MQSTASFVASRARASEPVSGLAPWFGVPRVTRITHARWRVSETGGMTQPRMRTVIPTEFRATSLSGKGEVRNVSDGGLFVGTSAIPKEGDCVELKLSAPGKPPIEVTGLVWWTTSDLEAPNARSGFGLRLLEQSDQYLRLVESLR